MNEHLRDRVIRKLDALSDERGYQVLDYLEFLESKYAERQAPPGNIFTRFSEAVEDRLRAGKVSATTIAETVGLMNRAFNALNGVATGVAAAGRSVANDFATAAATRGTAGSSTSAPGGGTAPASAASAGAPVASTAPGSASPAGSGSTGSRPPIEPAAPPPVADPRATESGELESPLGP